MCWHYLEFSLACLMSNLQLEYAEKTGCTSILVMTSFFFFFSPCACRHHCCPSALGPSTTNSAKYGAMLPMIGHKRPTHSSVLQSEFLGLLRACCGVYQLLWGRLCQVGMLNALEDFAWPSLRGLRVYLLGSIYLFIFLVWSVCRETPCHESLNPSAYLNTGADPIMLEM